MKRISNRSTLAARSPGAVLALSGLMFLTGCATIPEKNIHTEIAIDAPPERVWAILADNASYAEWNPYHVRVAGELSEGSTLDLTIHKPNGAVIEISPRVMRNDPPRELTWGGGIRGIFFGRHRFVLFPDGESGTRLVHSERFSGVAIPFAELDAIEEGYRGMNAALKARVEGAAHGS